ncbi:hypothetical protein KAI04_00855 [Candidatus Pacearchaeota archaeon]|nr:hypothetical protein [Candidatus Pacearchaeota archaeon]
MKIEFTPIDYDYFDFQGRNYAKIIGRNNKGKRVCIIDSCPVYLWAILKDKVKENKTNKLIEKIQKIKLNVKGRQTKVEKVEIHDKNFMGKQVKALKIFATNYKDLHDIADKLDLPEIEKRRGYDLGYITHYIIEKKLNPLNWYEISGELLNNSQDFGGIDMALDVDFCIKTKQIKELKNKTTFKPKTLAYDIETDKLEIGKGEILMISLVGDNFKKVITWKKSKSKQDYVEYVNDEVELIEKFIEYIKKVSPDFLVGYFSDGFDLPYLKARAEKHKIRLNLGLDNSQPKFSRGITMTAKIKGITHIDILKFIRTTYAQYMQSETLTLNEVAKEFLGDTKKDFKIKHSSELEEHDWKKYYEYNLHDSVLTLDLFRKFWPDMLEFTKIIQEPIFDISRNGLSKQVESYIIHNLNRFNEIPEKRPTYDEIAKRRHRQKVEGAFVLEPKPGLYENLVMFDFTSMHTSIIISMNISRETLLEKPEKNAYSIKTREGTYYFSKKQGFFPTLLKEIFDKRKEHKKAYQKNPDVITLARSNAFKVLSASAHGYLGFFGARYYSIESSASILAFVRKFNQEAIEKTEKAGHKVIYGDSIGGDSKIIIKKGDKIYEEEIKNLFEKIDSKNPDKKEYNLKKNTKVLTLDEKGNSVFKPIKYVMRHKTNKKMYRIHFTNNWNIDTTEDHSLIGYQSSHFNQTEICKKDPLKRLTEIKPEEIKKKANNIITLSKIPNKFQTKNYPKEVYEFIGFFIGDGSFCRNKQHNKNNKDYYLGLSLGLDSEEVINKLIKPLIKLGYIKNYWESKTRKGDIKINGLKLIKIISQNCRNKENKKIIPSWLFDEKEENIASFLRGLFSADGTVMIRNNAPIIKFTSINQGHINNVRKLLFRVGISHSTFKENNPNKYKTKQKIYSSRSYSKNIILKDKEKFHEEVGFLLKRKNDKSKIKTKGIQKKLIKNFEFDLQGVKKIEQIKTPKYVYDIEVEDNHRFFANYVLVHNTDSVAFTSEKKSKKQILGFLKKLNKDLPGIMELELDGFFKRGLWVTTRAGTVGAKKKYALIDEKNNIKIRGFETVRRDWCKLARNVQSKVINQILKDGNEKKSLEYLKNIVKKVKQREINKEDIIIKTQLKKPLSEYKAISPHVIAARKMQEKAIPVGEGNLINYFIAETRDKKKLVRDKVKLPTEKGEYNIKYYLERQLMPAVENIFQVFDVNIKEIIEGKRQMTLGDF